MATSSPLWRHARTFAIAQLSVASSMLIGDTACQYIARNDPHPAPSADIHPLLPSISPALSPHIPPFIDPDRSLTMLLTGLCVSGPWSFLVLSTVEHLFPGKAMRAVLSKVALNGLIAPLGISMAFTTITMLEGRGWEKAKGKVKDDLASTWSALTALRQPLLRSSAPSSHLLCSSLPLCLAFRLTGALYWPFVSTLNFRYVPFTWRPLFSGLAGAAWGTYMSRQAHKSPTVASPETPAPATTALAVTATTS